MIKYRTTRRGIPSRDICRVFSVRSVKRELEFPDGDIDLLRVEGCVTLTECELDIFRVVCPLQVFSCPFLFCVYEIFHDLIFYSLIRSAELFDSRYYSGNRGERTIGHQGDDFRRIEFQPRGKLIVRSIYMERDMV